MKKNTFENLTNEELIKKRDLLKGASIGLGIVVVIAIAILIYLFATKGLKSIPIATLIPVFVLPIVFTPLLISFGQLNKEIKTRNL